MSRLTNWIKGHQVTAFLIITFAITWGLGFSFGAVMNKDIFLLAPLASIALCGPALAGDHHLGSLQHPAQARDT